MSVAVARFKRSAKTWEFKWDSEAKAWLYRTRLNLYQLFIDNDGNADVWVGRYAPGQGCWFTDEARLGIASIELGRVVITFK